jgi:hypothetical protein
MVQVRTSDIKRMQALISIVNATGCLFLVNLLDESVGRLRSVRHVRNEPPVTDFPALNCYLSIPKFYCVNFSVFAVDARSEDVNFHRGAPSRGLEWAGFEAASATGPAGRHTAHFPTTLPFSKPILRMTPIYVIFDISRWREYYASGVGCY